MDAGECFFVSDLHGSHPRYETLFRVVRERRPAALFLGGDLLPPFGGYQGGEEGFLEEVILAGLGVLRAALGPAYPKVFAILGNDDPRALEARVEKASAVGLWEYVHGRRGRFRSHPVYGYGCIPPSPFLLKDWERYDVSRHVDPGCSSPEDGWHTAPDAPGPARPTIQAELAEMVGGDDLRDAILLVHVPPYRSKLDRAALDGRAVDHAPLDVHVGSIAVRRLLEERQPLVALHGHVHESARLTGSWCDRIGRTVCLSAAHDGPELALVSFDPARPEAAARELLASG